MFKVPIPIGEEEEQVVPVIAANAEAEERDKKTEKKEDTLARIKILTDFSKQITIQVGKSPINSPNN